MSENTIVITGGTGFAGSHLVEALLEQGETNIHVTSFGTQNTTVHQLLPSSNIHQIDLQKSADVLAFLTQIKPNQIYHLAALAAVGSSFSAAETQLINNTLLQLSILESVKSVCPEAKLLIVGSAQEYDVISNPTEKIAEDHPLGPGNPYAVSKVTQDLLALSYYYAYKLNVLRTRPFNHIGERQSPAFAVPSFAQQIALLEKNGGGVLKVGNLSGVRDFTDVKDVVRAYIMIMNSGKIGEVYNIGSGKGVSMQSVVDQLLSLATAEITVEKDESRFRPLDVHSLIADNTKITQLGWNPEIPFSDTIHRIMEYWRKEQL